MKNLEALYFGMHKVHILILLNASGAEILKKMKQKDVVTFLKWKNEWTKHLQQNRVRPWVEPKALATFVPDQDAL